MQRHKYGLVAEFRDFKIGYGATDFIFFQHEVVESRQDQVWYVAFKVARSKRPYLIEYHHPPHEIKRRRERLCDL